MCDCFFLGQVTIWPTLKSNYKPKNVAGISITIVDLAPVIVAATTVNSTHKLTYTLIYIIYKPSLIGIAASPGNAKANP